MPKKLKVDSARIELGIVKVKVTTNGPTRFGNNSLNIIWILLNPEILAFIINGWFFNSNTLALVILAILIQLNSESASVIPSNHLPKISINIETNNKSGIE